MRLILEVLHALVEAMDALDRPGPFQVRTGFGDIAGGFAEGGHDDDFGFAHLENKQEQADDQNQKGLRCQG